jgi:hypothetical protein
MYGILIDRVGVACGLLFLEKKYHTGSVNDKRNTWPSRKWEDFLKQKKKQILTALLGHMLFIWVWYIGT